MVSDGKMGLGRVAWLSGPSEMFALGEIVLRAKAEW